MQRWLANKLAVHAWFCSEDACRLKGSTASPLEPSRSLTGSTNLFWTGITCLDMAGSHWNGSIAAFKHGWNMFGLHSTLYTPRFTLSTPLSAFHTLDSILRSPRSTLHALYSKLSRSTLRTLHSTLHVPHCTLYTLHSNSTLYTLHSTLYSPRFAIHTPHSTLHILHSTHLPRSFAISSVATCTLPTYYRFWRCTVVSEDLPCIGACALASAPWSPYIPIRAKPPTGPSEPSKFI